MYILTNEKNAIIEISNTYELDTEHRNIKVDGYNIAYGPDEKINVYEVLEVPENVKAEKYCYTEEKGFYENENYREYFSQEDRISALEDTVNMLLGF